MGLGLSRILRRFKLELVPGYEISFFDLLFFRRNLLGESAPLNLYGRWRKSLGSLIQEQHFLKAGLENLKDVYPGKVDR